MSAGTNHTSFSLNRSAAARATLRCPRWMGSNVPPNSALFIQLVTTVSVFTAPRASKDSSTRQIGIWHLNWRHGHPAKRWTESEVEDLAFRPAPTSPLCFVIPSGLQPRGICFLDFLATLLTAEVPLSISSRRLLFESSDNSTRTTGAFASRTASTRFAIAHFKSSTPSPVTAEIAYRSSFFRLQYRL